MNIQAAARKLDRSIRASAKRASTPVRLWLDAEWNGFRGDLISMALVADDGREWYEVLPCSKPTPWIEQNVLPVLNKQAVTSPSVLSLSLCEFLAEFQSVHIIADWPEDLAYFCFAMVPAPLLAVPRPPMTMSLRTDLPATASISAVPHNALADARALRDAAMAQERKEKPA